MRRLKDLRVMENEMEKIGNLNDNWVYTSLYIVVM